MSDLMERLRELATETFGYDPDTGEEPENGCENWNLMQEAADEIKRLRSRLTEATAFGVECQKALEVERGLRAEAEALLREARDSVRNHWRKHARGLVRAIRTDRLDTIPIEAKREAELRGLRDRIDAFLNQTAQKGER